MTASILLSPLLMMSFLFCFLPEVNQAQTVKKDPVSGQYIIQGNSLSPLHNTKLKSSKFNQKRVEQQLNKLKKVSKLHSLIEHMNKAKLKADHDRSLKQKISLPQLEKVKLFGKHIPLYKSPYVPEPPSPGNSNHLLTSNVLINGKAHDTVFVNDPFTLTFSFAPNTLTAAVNIYIDVDNNGMVSPGDLLITNGLVMDNSDYDSDPASGTYKMIVPNENGISAIITSLIIEINDYQSVSSAVLTVIPKPFPSIILGSLNYPLKNIIVRVDDGQSSSFVLTDSLGKFITNVDRSHSSQVNVRTFDQFGISNGYVPPSSQIYSLLTDTTSIDLVYQLATSFIEGYAKDQFSNPVKNVQIEADGDFYMIGKTDSLGYYKMGVSPGFWYIYPSISWTNDYLRNENSSLDFNAQVGNNTLNLSFMKANSTISGLVTFNKNGIEGIPVYGVTDTLYNLILTSQNGIYSMPVYKYLTGTNLYNVSPSVAPGYIITTPTWTGLPPAQNISFEFQKITGGVEGTITDSKTGKPIADASVSFSGNTYKSGYSDENGYFKVSLLDGIYIMTVEAEGYHFYQQYDVTVSGNIININVALLHSASISGNVMDKEGKPLYNAYVYAFDSLYINYGTGYVDNLGHYIINGLSSSDYKVYANMYGYITQFYNNVYSPDSATVIHVTDGYDTPGINFVLTKGGSISGKVIDKLGNAISDVIVEIYDSLFTYGVSGTTDESGTYSISGLNSGKYYVRAFNQLYIYQWYNGASDLEHANFVNVIIDQNTSDINFTLEKGSVISGYVKDKNNNGISYANVTLLDSLFNVINYGNCDSYGKYSVYQLQPGKKYFAYASAYGYGDRWYNNVSVSDSASPIVLLPEETKDNINFNLPVAGSISGRVLDNNGVPVSNVYISIEDPLGYYFYSGYSDIQGYYTVTNINNGEYYASVDDYIHLPQWFDHKTSQQQADLIKVIENQTTPNINFNLIKSSADSVVIKLTLDKIPDTLRFSQSYVDNNYTDYWWGVSFDVDGDINTGTSGCEIEIALMHYKSAGDSEFISNIIDGTYHILLQWVGVNGYWLHTDVNVRIDPSDKNTLLMTVPKSWTEINQVTSQTRFYAHSGYNSSSGWVTDYTSVGKDMVSISDPVDDVAYNFIDIVSAGWSMKIVDNISSLDIQPVEFKLEQNYPNPFNPSTKIRYALPYESSVRIIVYNLLGQAVRQVVSEVQKSGYHEVNFNADNLASGVYFYSIVASSTSNKQEFKDVKKMLLIK